MLNVKSRYAVDPVAAKSMDTCTLREHFHLGDIFATGEIRLEYTHYDRMIVGAAVPGDRTLTLDKVAECGTQSILDRREMGILNVGEAATVTAAGKNYSLNRGDMLYLGMGSGAIEFSGPGRFYLLSSPAHTTHPSRIITIEEAASFRTGSAETANDRTIYQFIHPAVMPSCQLVMGYTQFHDGSVWNTMPAHVHDRRMEAYLYFDMQADQRVFHFMGEPDETRHLVIANEEAIVSPPWSIHCGAGTGSYTFCWGMAGDNVDYTDLEMVAMEDLR